MELKVGGKKKKYIRNNWMGPDLDWNAVCRCPENRWPGGLPMECGGPCCAGTKKDVYSPSFVNRGENTYAAVGIYSVYALVYYYYYYTRCLQGVSNAKSAHHRSNSLLWKLQQIFRKRSKLQPSLNRSVSFVIL